MCLRRTQWVLSRDRNILVCTRILHVLEFNLPFRRTRRSANNIRYGHEYCIHVYMRWYTDVLS